MVTCNFCWWKATNSWQYLWADGGKGRFI